MDEIAVTFFLYGREYTLPLEIWGRLRRGITPELTLISHAHPGRLIILITVWYHLRTRSERQLAQPILAVSGVSNATEDQG